MDRNESGARQLPHQLIMQDRQQLEITGVSDVQSFDEHMVKAYTSLGELSVIGANLHIKRLDLESGSFSLEGRIDSLVYTDTVRGGFFGRLFR